MHTALCLSLMPAQVCLAVPDTPIDTAQAVIEEVREAARRMDEEIRRRQSQIEQMNEVMDSQQKALDAQADSHEARSADDVPAQALLPGDTESLTDTEQVLSQTESEAYTETESEFTDETETEFQPVEMGESLPDTDSRLPDVIYAAPEEGSLNEARISLYDYRMLREYPIYDLPRDLRILQRQLMEQTGGYDGTWSVYVQNLNTGQEIILNDSSLRSASVMKLFIMGAVYEAFDRGRLPRNEDNVYLLRSMITNSSNESSNRLLTLLGDGDIAAGVARVNDFIRLRGFSDGTIEYNGFEDPNASLDPDHPNVIAAKDVGLLLSRIYHRSFISRRVCNEIEQMLLDQATRYKIPRGLPEGVECGNKSGETDTIANDAAFVYGPTSDYILVILSNDWSSEDTANAQIAELSKTVYEFFESGSSG